MYWCLDSRPYRGSKRITDASLTLLLLLHTLSVVLLMAGS